MLLRHERARGALTLLAEFALIFAGITAAIWFENANAARHERALEAEIIAEMVEGLASDTTDLRGNLRNVPVFLASTDTVLQRLTSGTPYSPDLDIHFGNALGINIFFENRAAYQHLQSAGLDVISDSDLRLQIARYYEFQIPAHRATEELMVRQPWSEMLRPQMMTRFTFSDGNNLLMTSGVEPLDYPGLRNDPEFHNTLRVYAAGLRGQIAISRGTLNLADSLLVRMSNGPPAEGS